MSGCDCPPVKAQGIRLADVFVIGPLMVVASTMLPADRRYTALALRFFGVGTVLYNGRNYLLIKQAERLRQGLPENGQTRRA